MHPLLGAWPATQACALTGNQTNDPLVHRALLNPLSHTSQGALYLLPRAGTQDLSPSSSLIWPKPRPTCVSSAVPLSHPFLFCPPPLCLPGLRPLFTSFNCLHVLLDVLLMHNYLVSSSTFKRIPQSQDKTDFRLRTQSSHGATPA